MDSFIGIGELERRMFCPLCGRAMIGPPSGREVAYPMHTCVAQGVVYDERRGAWYGLPEIEDRLNCPACGGAMDAEPKEPPVRIFFCYQCGTTFDRTRGTWYGLTAHHQPP